jgi:TetR/AcrR family transcriptional regulator
MGLAPVKKAPYLAGMDKPSIREINERTILKAAESVFAERGFSGATVSMIAARAGAPKANVHYYFPTKEGLYRAVVEQVLTAWLDAAASFDASDDPVEALTAYIGAKMDLARELPLSSQIYASEMMHGAPVVQDYLETTLADWVRSRSAVVRRWIAEGKLRPVEPKVLFYMIWATTQHYANAAHEIATLEGGALSGEAFEQAKRQVVETLLFGVTADPILLEATPARALRGA